MSNRWLRKLITAAAIFHGSSILFANLPESSVYPSNPLRASGLTGLRWGETQLVDLRHWLGSLKGVETVLGGYNQRLGLSQHWTMFAPVPPTHEVYHSVVAERDDGTSQILWQWTPGTVAPYSWYEQRFMENLAGSAGPLQQFLVLRRFSRMIEATEQQTPKEMYLLESAAALPLHTPLANAIQVSATCRIPREASLRPSD